jgi:ATP-dependent Clp protease protease subunit
VIEESDGSDVSDNTPNKKPEATMSVIPMVVEKSGQVERYFDIYSRLLKDRIVFLGSAIDDHVANVVVAQMLFLQSENKKEDINLYINCPGGSVSAGLAIYDTMRFVECSVATYCIGLAASMGAVLFGAGAKGKRYALPNAKIMIHQPWGGMEGTASDIQIHAEEIIKTKKRLIEILADETGQPIEQVTKDTDRDFFLSAEEARKYGIVDEVLMPGKSKLHEAK